MIEIVPVNGAFHVVDKSVPGWALIEQHSTRARAELARDRARAARGVSVDRPGGLGEATAEALQNTLSGRAGDVRKRIAAIRDADMLIALEQLEGDDLGRPSVLKAIRLQRDAVTLDI